jgi:precorrin-2 dehydrogenase/sirohydrochlorin ferrochelatase
MFIDIREKQVLVIGQYRVLEFKMEKLIEAGAKIIYLAEILPEKIEKHIKSGAVTFIKEEYHEKFLQDVWLVVVGSNDIELKKRIEEATTQRHIFCNFVDEAPISSFISPSVIAKGDITIAISTKGKSPALNKLMKSEIDKVIGDEYVFFAEMLGKMRQKVLENIPTQKQRGDLFDSIVQNPAVLELIREKKFSQAEQLVRDLIDQEINSQVINRIV